MQYRYADEGSPLAAFLGTFYSIVQTRKVAASVGMVFGWDKWGTFVGDMQMLFEEGQVMGIRTAWVRRVLVPALQAQGILQSNTGTEKSRAMAAMETLKQLINADDALYASSVKWLSDLLVKLEADAAIEARAQEIYNAFPYDGPGDKPAWAPSGNSLKQDEARRAARAELVP